MKLEHIAINVPDPTAMAKWYAENLEMQIVRSAGEPRYEHFIADKNRQSVMEIYHNPAAPIPDYSQVHPLMLHFAFLVDNIEETHSRLVEAGATPVGEISTTPAGDQLAFLRDPWNVSIQLVKRQKPLVA